MNIKIERPETGEHSEFFARYVNRIPVANAMDALLNSIEQTVQIFLTMTPQQAEYRYAEGKWTPKEILLHVTDAERIMGYRALVIARGETLALPGFDEDIYASVSGANLRTMESIVNEFCAVRTATISLFRDSLPQAALLQSGMVNGWQTTVRSFAWIIAGHEAHHSAVIHERYLGSF